MQINKLEKRNNYVGCLAILIIMQIKRRASKSKQIHALLLLKGITIHKIRNIRKTCFQDSFIAT